MMMIDIKTVETLQLEVEVLLESLLNGEFNDLKNKKVLIFAYPMESPRLACILYPSIFGYALIFIQGYNSEKNFKNLSCLKEIIRHELLHLRLGMADDDDEIFKEEAEKINIILAKNWRKKWT
jgi:hypothetical protein